MLRIMIAFILGGTFAWMTFFRSEEAEDPEGKGPRYRPYLEGWLLPSYAAVMLMAVLFLPGWPELAKRAAACMIMMFLHISLYFVLLLLAQPFLRRWLQAHGYTIRRELLSREGDTLYTTFEVYAGPMAKLTPAELWAGRQTRGEGSPLRLAYLDRLLRQTERAIAGLKRSKRPEDASRLAELEQVHQGLLDMKEEWLSWQR